jgi:preprotein translocase subunit SecG
MQVITTVLVAIQMLSALVMIGLILVQHGKGADMGAAFGSGGSGSLLGVSGSANFMSRATGVLATVFFVCTLALAYFSGVRPVGSGSILERAGVSAPAETASGPAAGAAGGASGAASGSAPIPTAASPSAAPAASAASPASAAPAPALTPAPASAASGAAPIPTK